MKIDRTNPHINARDLNDVSMATTFFRVFTMVLGFAFVVVGATTLGLGIYAKITGPQDGFMLPDLVLVGTMAVGTLLIVMGISGCASLKHRSCLVLYTILLAILIAGELMLSVFTMRHSLDPADFLDQTWDNSSAEARLNVQDVGDCCGFFAPNDRMIVSPTCPTGVQVGRRGCLPVLRQHVVANEKIIYGSAYVIIGVQVFMLITCLVSLYRLRRIRQHCERNYDMPQGVVYL